MSLAPDFVEHGEWVATPGSYHRTVFPEPPWVMVQSGRKPGSSPRAPNPASRLIWNFLESLLRVRRQQGAKNRPAPIICHEPCTTRNFRSQGPRIAFGNEPTAARMGTQYTHMCIAYIHTLRHCVLESFRLGSDSNPRARWPRGTRGSDRPLASLSGSPAIRAASWRHPGRFPSPALWQHRAGWQQAEGKQPIESVLQLLCLQDR